MFSTSNPNGFIARGITDVRYGVVGYSQDTNSAEHAHSQVVDLTVGALDLLYGSTQSQLTAAFSSLTSVGGFEDGWDAIEHAIAEYRVREGAVTIFVLVQSENGAGGRNALNTTLTDAGVRATLASKNAILNVIVSDSGAPIFLDANPEDNVRTIGIVADNLVGSTYVDNFDLQHTAYVRSGSQTIFGVFDDSIPGQILHAEAPYVRPAWDSGGAVWDLGFIGGIGGITSPDAVALQDAFIGSLGDQILAAAASRKIFEQGVTIVEANIGGPAIGDYEADGAPGSLFVPEAWSRPVGPDGGPEQITDYSSNAIPDNARPGQAGDVFKTGRVAALADYLQLRGVAGESVGAEGFVANNSSVVISPSGVGTVGGSVAGYKAQKLATFGMESFTSAATPITFDPFAGNGNFFLDISSLNGFSFNFFGQSYNEFRVYTNGAVSLGPDPDPFSLAKQDWSITDPDRSIRPTIAALFADLVFDSVVAEPPSIIWEVLGAGTGAERLVIEWHSLNYARLQSFPMVDPTGLTFQAVLYANGDIRFNYLDVVMVPIDGPTVTPQNADELEFGGPTEGAVVGVVAPATEGDLSFTVNVPNGSYVVEMFFAVVDGVNNARPIVAADVVMEGVTILDNYRPDFDYASIAPLDADERIVAQAGATAAVVKRFRIDVVGNNGLQVDLVQGPDWFAASPIINGVRVLQDPLPGDYDRNGAVDYYDFMLWKDTFGDLVDPSSAADGNGNGVVDAADYTIWSDAYVRVAGHLIADFNGDEMVTIEDFNLWKSTLGSTTDLRADANRNGVVDAADFTIWRDTFGSIVGAARFGLLSAAFGPDVPPEVVGFSLAFAGAGGFDFAVATGSGEQLRSVPLASANTINITFNQQVVVTQGALTLVNLDGAVPMVENFAYDSDAQTATWTFDAPLADGRYLVRLSDSVHDTDNEALDGEFTNPWALADTATTIFPSGDGEAGGEFRFRFTILAGDSDHNNIDGSTDYQNWQSYEPGMIHVSTTTDELDADLSFGDVSLREAVNYANGAAEATTIDLPAGRYTLTLAGTEVTGTAQNDLDVSGNVTILGAGAGLSVIVPDWTASVPSEQNRVFDVNGVAARLRLERLTVSGGYGWSSPLGMAALAQNQAELEIVDSAIVNNIGYGTGVAIRSVGSDVTILRSVFTNNQGYDGVAVWATEQGANTGSLTIGESIFALNSNWGNYTGTTPNVKAATNVVKTSLGKNLYDNGTGGFFDVVWGAGDHLGTPHYVVTTVADTFNHADNVESLSIREAVDKANTTAGVQEIWIPAWNFVLTRDRTTYGGGSLTDIDAAFGDLDIKESLIIRGVAERTSIAWKAGIVDEVFDLLGDYNHDGQPDFNYVSSADYTIWQSQNGSTGDYEEFSADGDDDGDVDQDDYNIWLQNFGQALQLFDVLS